MPAANAGDGRDETLAETVGVLDRMGFDARYPTVFDRHPEELPGQEAATAAYVTPLDKVVVFGPGLDNWKPDEFYVGSMLAYMHQVDAAMPEFTVDPPDPQFTDAVQVVEDGYKRFQEAAVAARYGPGSEQDIYIGAAVAEADDTALAAWIGRDPAALLAEIDAGGFGEFRETVPDPLLDRRRYGTLSVPEPKKRRAFRAYVGSLAADMTDWDDIAAVGDNLEAICPVHGRDHAVAYRDFMKPYHERRNDGYGREAAAAMARPVVERHLTEIATAARVEPDSE